MTRNEYIDELKSRLGPLTLDEQNEAVQYYEDYFNEAGDDDKVIEELGMPEELAKTIIEKFANALTKNEQTASQSKDSDEKTVSGAMYYEYNPSAVKNLSVKFSTAEVVAIKGDKFSVETRGLTENDLHVHLGIDGLLTVTNEKKININFWTHDRSRRVVPRILLSIPDNVHLENLKLQIDAGKFESNNISLFSDQLSAEVGAGNLIISGIKSGTARFRCGMGNLSFDGSVSKADVDCGMGAVKLNLKGKKDDFSYDAKVGLGDVKINGEKKSGFYQNSMDSVKKENHISVNCGMGNVTINIQE